MRIKLGYIAVFATIKNGRDIGAGVRMVLNGCGTVGSGNICVQIICFVRFNAIAKLNSFTKSFADSNFKKV